MKNVEEYQLKKCIFMEPDEFDRITSIIFDGNCTTLFSTDGVNVCPDNKFLKDNKIIIDKLSEYFDTNVVSYHIDDEDNTGVWICYDDRS